MLALLSAGCDRAKPEPGADALPHSAPAASVHPPQRAVPQTSHVSLLELKDRCQLREHGLVLDLGSRAALAYENFQLNADDPPTPLYVQGQSFRALDQMSQDFVFWTRTDTTAFGFEALVRGGASERMAVYVDGERWGAAQLKQDEVRVVRIARGEQVLPAGRHRLTLALSRPRGSQPQADIGWVRLGQLSKTNSDQPASRDQVFSEVTIDDDRLASVVVKPGASVSCPVWLTEQSVLSLSLGVWGAGLAEGEIALVDRNGQEHVLARDVREEDQPRTYRPLQVDLGPFAGQLVDIVFRAQSHAPSARVVFGAPRLSRPSSIISQAPRAKRAVVVILSALGTRHTPPESAHSGLPIFNQIAQFGASFPRYRATSTSATAIIASLLTGLWPYQHNFSGLDQRLSNELPTLSSAIEAAGGRSSFMTGVPTSSAAFGFDRGFESFLVTLPQEDIAATEPVRQATQWLKATLDAEGPVLSFIHLRGAHPPFDISRERARELPPPEYGGDLTPRRAAIQLGAIARRPERQQGMNDEDWIKVAEMEKAALSLQNEALTDLVHWLRQADLYDDTLLIVVGDVGPGERPRIPYSEDAGLSEPYLAVPLLIKFPRGHLAGRSIDGFFAPHDLTRTVAASLGVEFDPKASLGIDLSRSDASDLARRRPHIAYRTGRYSLRLGSQLLTGMDGRAPELCFVEIDPSCQFPRAADHPATVHSLWLMAFSAIHDAQRKAPSPTLFTAEPELQNAFVVWGNTP